jgi:hypothetical protein
LHNLVFLSNSFAARYSRCTVSKGVCAVSPQLGWAKLKSASPNSSSALSAVKSDTSCYSIR